MSERQVTPKTWDEVVEIAAEAAFEQLSAGRAWDSASAMEREERRIEANAALHALRAAGLAVVPRGETTAIGYVMSGINGQPTWSAALSAGELAPPDKGEG